MTSATEELKPATTVALPTPAPAPGTVETLALGLWATLRRQAVPTAKYLMETEVHTYAFSVAANAILSFFPSIVLMLTLTRRVFHSQMMMNVLVNDKYGLLAEYLPSNQKFIIDNLGALAGHRVQIFSIIMLFISSTGIFLPLEVALNRVWGFTKNRSYLGNQLIALGLALGCGTLALASVGATAANWHLLSGLFGGGIVFGMFALVIMKIFAILASISGFFLIYWLLPNGKVPVRAVMPAAVIMGVIFEAVKWIYRFALPWLDFPSVYGPFYVSVTLMFYAFVTGLLLLGGAYLSAAEHNSRTAAANQASA